MKIILYILLLGISLLSYSQNDSNVKTMLLPDSNELVFHSTPFVDIEIHGIQIRRLFDYETTKTLIETTQSALIKLNFTNNKNIQLPEYIEILDNSEFVKLFANKDRNITKITNQLSKLSNQYTERYVCFILQYGATSTQELAQAKAEGNNNSYAKSYSSGSVFYEINLTTVHQILFLVFDKNTQNIVHFDICGIANRNNNKIFSKKITTKLLLKLKRRLKRNIIKNLRKKGCAF